MLNSQHTAVDGADRMVMTMVALSINMREIEREKRVRNLFNELPVLWCLNGLVPFVSITQDLIKAINMMSA